MVKESAKPPRGFVFTTTPHLMPACQVLVHNPVLQNGLRAIYTRIFCVKNPDVPGGYSVCPEPSRPKIFSTLHKLRDSIVRNTVVPDVVPLQDVPSMYIGRKKQVYERAYNSLCETPVNRTDSYIRAFTKKEKLVVSAGVDSVLSPAQLDSKDPRIIQPRNPRYNLELASYLKTLEHRLFQAIDHTYGATTVFKGLNAVEQGTKLAEAWTTVRNPVGIRMDFKRFDQHVSREALEFEHSFYVNCYRKLRQLGRKVNIKQLKMLLSWQLDNNCVLRVPEGTIRYRTRGKRMSGDNNTGLGNVVLVCTMFLLFLKTVGIPISKCRLVNNGDDCCLIIDQKWQAAVLKHLQPYFLQYGFEIDVEGVSTQLEDIRFCQCNPVEVRPGEWIMVRDLDVSRVKDAINLKPMPTKESHDVWRSQIAGCGLALTSGIPVMQEFYLALARGVDPTRSGDYVTGMDFLAHGLVARVHTPTDTARISFFSAFGITPDEQLQLERHYRGLVVKYQVDQPVDHTDGSVWL